MSTTDRKARKRAGIPFERAPKTATPPQERALPLVQESAARIPHVSRRAIVRLERRYGTTAD